MIAASVLGLPAILLLLTVLPCIRMGHEPGVAKYRRAQLAGVMLILLGKTAFCRASHLGVDLKNLRSCCSRDVARKTCESTGENASPCVFLYVSWWVRQRDK